MPMSPENAQKFIQHLAKFRDVENHPCWFCGKDDWRAEGPFSLQEAAVVGNVLKSFPESMPVAALRCSNCDFVQFFAWLPIVSGEE
jgi:hypothetical protein